MSFVKTTLPASTASTFDLPADFANSGVAFVGISGSATAGNNKSVMLCIPAGTADTTDVLVGAALTNITLTYVVPTASAGPKVRITQAVGETSAVTYVYFSPHAIGG